MASSNDPQNEPQIGQLNEGSLHRAVKHWYAEWLLSQQLPVQEEVPLGRHVIDLVAGDQLIEIQTGSFGALRSKLEQLLPDHPVRVLVPIAVETLLVGERDGKRTRRRSPKRGNLYDVLDAFVSLPTLLAEPNFQLEALLIDETLARRWNPAYRRRRGGWQVLERSLREVRGRYRFASPACLWTLCETQPQAPFDTQDLADAMAAPRASGQKLAYCLRKLGEIEAVDKVGNAVLYQAAERRSSIGA